MNRNSVLLIASLLGLFSVYFYFNYRMSNPSHTAPAAAVSASTDPSAPVVNTAASPAAQSVETAMSPATGNAADTSSAIPNPSGAAGGPVAVATPQIPDFVPVADTEDLGLKIPAGQIRYSKQGGCIGELQLSNYKQTADKQDAALLFENFSLCKAFGLKWGDKDLREAPVAFERLSETSVRLRQRIDSVDVVRTWSFGFKDYTSELKVEVFNFGGSPVQGNLAIELGGTSEHKKAGGMFSAHAIEYRQFLYADSEKVHRTHLTFESAPKLEEVLNVPRASPAWFGTDSIYFLTALMPQHREALDFLVKRTGFNIQKAQGSEDVRTVYEAWASLPVQIAPQSSKTYDYKVYMGPKQRALLKTIVDSKATGTLGLEEAIDYGFFRIVALPMYIAMEWLFQKLGNWGLAIIALTLAIKLLFYPLMVKAYISGKKMQKMQPLMNEVKEKYKDDKQKQQQEMMALMSKQGVNPVSGCLPILPQIPVFFGLNSVLTHTFELRHAPFYGWIRDLSFHDPYYASPVLMALLMFVQQKMTPMPSMEPAQQKLMQFMPLIFAVFMLAYPSGLVVYIVTNSVVSIIQQQYMMKKYKDV